VSRKELPDSAREYFKGEGAKGGKKGGPARAAKLTPERRSEIARKAAQARWAKDKNHKAGE